jgi:hypothetical protein
MKLSITKSKNFINDCRRYEEVIKKTKSTEIENLYKQFLSQANMLDTSVEFISSNFSTQIEVRNRLKSLRSSLEKKIIDLKEKTQQS